MEVKQLDSYCGSKQEETWVVVDTEERVRVVTFRE